MNIRLAIPSDLAAITECAAQAYHPYVVRMGKNPAPMVADFASQIAAGIVHVATDDDGLAGFIVFYPRGDHLHLENVAVLPDRHGQGIGAKLIAFVESTAKRDGCAAVELYTNEKMTENLAYYPRLGYREISRGEQDGFNRVFYRKEV